MSIFVSFSAVSAISFYWHFRLRLEMKNCFSVGLWYTSQKGLGLEMQSLGLGLEH